MAASRKKTVRAGKASRKTAKPQSARSAKSVAAPSLGKGSRVEWAYGAGKAIGKVLQVFRQKVTRRIKGAVITRNGTAEKPAVLLKSDQGGQALKSASELKKPSSPS